MEKIIIIQSAFIGDAILVSGLVETVRKQKPKAEIHLLLRKGNEGLYKDHPYLTKVWIWDKKRKYASLLSLVAKIRKERFDWLFCVQRFGSMGLLSSLSKAKYKVGFAKNPWSKFFTYKIDHNIGDGTHEIERNTKLLEPWLGKDLKAEKPKLCLMPGDYNRAAVYRKKEYLCMFPSSVWFTKQLPKEKWVELCKQYSNYPIYLMGAPGDAALAEEIKALTGLDNIEILCGKLSLNESAALMQDATMNFVNDSAPLHLASATNSKVKAFFCSTVSSFGFGPLADDAEIIENTNKLDCRPCGLHGKKSCPLGHFKCGFDIDISKIQI